MKTKSLDNCAGASTVKPNLSCGHGKYLAVACTSLILGGLIPLSAQMANPGENLNVTVGAGETRSYVDAEVNNGGILTITNLGTIKNTNGEGVKGASYNLGDVNMDNRGVIEGTSAGATFFIGGGGANITNSGTITAVSNALELYDEYNYSSSPAGTVKLTNEAGGKITSTSGKAVNILRENASFELVNNGTIQRVGAPATTSGPVVDLVGKRGTFINTGLVQGENDTLSVRTSFSEGGLIVNTGYDAYILGMQIDGVNTRVELNNRAMIGGSIYFADSANHTLSVSGGPVEVGMLHLGAGNTFEVVFSPSGITDVDPLEYLYAVSEIDITGSNINFDFSKANFDEGDYIVLMYSEEYIVGDFNNYNFDGVTEYEMGGYKFILSGVRDGMTDHQLGMTITGVVPEPATYAAILGIAMVSIALVRKRKVAR